MRPLCLRETLQLDSISDVVGEPDGAAGVVDCFRGGPPSGSLEAIA